MSDDQTKAAAIVAAKQWLDKKGWNYTPAQIGERAKEIIDALEGNS